MARRKPASKTGRTSTSSKSAKKSAGKPAKRAAAAQLGPEKALGPSLDSVATVIANLKALSAAPGAESVQADIGNRGERARIGAHAS